MILQPENVNITALLFADCMWLHITNTLQLYEKWGLLSKMQLLAVKKLKFDNWIIFYLIWIMNQGMKRLRSPGTVLQSLTHHAVWDEGSNIPVMLLNEDNSRTKLTSHLITGDLLNGLRQRSLSCIWEFTLSIYLDCELEAKWLFCADTKSHAAWHFTDITQRRKSWLFPQRKSNPKWQSGRATIGLTRPPYSAHSSSSHRAMWPE